MGLWTRDPDSDIKMKWRPMLLLSVIFHVSIFSLTLFLPESMPGAGRFQGKVYEVNLVDMPAKGGQVSKSPTPLKSQTAKTVLNEAAKAKRVKNPEKEKPVVISKRTVKDTKPPPKEKAVSATKMIDEAISKIEKRVKSERAERSHVDEAISKLENKIGADGDPSDSDAQDERPGGPMGSTGSGITLRIYQMEVETWIKSHWAYPVALQGPKSLEAVVVVMVKSDGSITKTLFKKRSSDNIFDQSVSKAIERSDPLPPFPEGYLKSHEEIEITFNLKELEKN